MQKAAGHAVHSVPIMRATVVAEPGSSHTAAGAGVDGRHLAWRGSGAPIRAAKVSKGPHLVNDEAHKVPLLGATSGAAGAQATRLVA